jgi:hypothetical protein
VKWLGVATLVAAVVLGGCNSDDGGADKPTYPKKFAFAVDYRLSGREYVYGFLDSCRGKGPYADLKTGAPVTLSTPDGTVVAHGSIQYATGTETRDQVLEECQFRISVKDVPRHRLYDLKIADQKPVPVSLKVMFAQAPLLLNANTPLVTLPTTTTT